MEDVAWFIQVHLPQAEHVENDPARRQSLPAHGVARPGDAQWELSVACLLDVVTELLFGRTPRARECSDLCNARLVQSAGIVGETGG
jgi:hypothetical protein